MDLYARSRCSLFRPHCVQFTHLRALLYEAGHAGLCRRIQYARAPRPAAQTYRQSSKMTLSLQDTRTPPSPLKPTPPFSTLPRATTRSWARASNPGPSWGRETNDADLAYCRALSSSGIADIPASANDLPFLSFLPYAIAQAPSFLPFIPSFSRRYSCSAPQPGTLAAKAPVPKFRRLIQTVFSIIAAGTAILAGLAPGAFTPLALNGFRADRVPDRLLP